MGLVSFCLLLLVTFASGASLLQVLQQIDQLSTLNAVIANSTTLTKLFSTADNFTFLAPSNTAFKQWMDSDGSSPNITEVEQTLQYHLLHGGFPVANINSTPQFASTNLPNGPMTANVTGGQVVEVVTAANGTPQFQSGNKTAATVKAADILCIGGIVHVVDNILEIPLSIPALSQQAKLKIFVAILEKGGFLSASNTPLLNLVLDTADVTVFIPNSADAMNSFNNISASNPSTDKLNSIFKYHFVVGFRGYSSNLFNGQKLRSLQGTNLIVTKRDNQTFINGAQITTSDLISQNGVVHVIDGLLNPANITTPPPPPSSGEPTGLSSTLLGIIITFAVLVPVAIAVAAYWFLNKRRKKVSEIRRNQYQRHMENQKEAAKFDMLNRTAELESPIETQKSQIPFARPAVPILSRVVLPPRKPSLYEMDGTSIPGLGMGTGVGTNKALPIPKY